MLRNVYEQLLMRGVPRPLLAIGIAFGMIAAVIIAIIAISVGFLGLVVLASNDFALFTALAVAAVVAILSVLLYYQYLPADPRKSKPKE